MNLTTAWPAAPYPIAPMKQTGRSDGSPPAPVGPTAATDPTEVADPADDAAIFDSRYSWGRLVITWSVAAIGNVGMWSFVSIMPAVQAEFGDSSPKPNTIRLHPHAAFPHARPCRTSVSAMATQTRWPPMQMWTVARHRCRTH